jgi:hypothetical protein
LVSLGELLKIFFFSKSVNEMGTKDPRADAEKYLEKHNVRGLFKYLSTKVLFAKPEDPRLFLVQELKKIRECQQDLKPASAFCSFPKAHRRHRRPDR